MIKKGTCQDNAKLKADYAALREAARFLVNDLTESEIEVARECWGHTNTNMIIVKRNELAAQLHETESSD